MKRIGEASAVMAEAVKLCEPKVIAVYPITPQTHIVERLAEHINNGELNAQIIEAESEHSMLSAIAGASLAGVRVFTATASQGMLLGHEVMHSIAGMRLPVVMGVASRALSSPLNVWGDHSDVMDARDTGWIQLHCKNSQEVFDTTIQAYAIAEQASLPVMVILDGFTLSHRFEPVELLSKEEVKKFLPPFKPKHFLDPANPKTFGAYAAPDYYMEIKHLQAQAMVEAKKIIKKVHDKFAQMFGRKYGNGFVEVFNKDAKKAIVCSGTTALTAQNLGCRVVHVKCFRPFPVEEIKKACKGAEDVVVIDRAYSYGSGGPLYLEVLQAVPNARSAIMGLGGRDIDISSLKKALNSKKKEIWVDNL